MGCSISKLEDEEVIKLCKDRKQFIKQAMEQRTRFASSHIAYIGSIKRVSAALREYIEEDEPHEFFLLQKKPTKKSTTNGFITISPKRTVMKVNYLRSGTAAVSVEEVPRLPETVRMETCYPSSQYGYDQFFATQSSNFSFFGLNSPERSSFPPPSPQPESVWDFFWNPFSSLDNYGYPNLDHSVIQDEVRGLRQVREEEGIPDLEEVEPESEGPLNNLNIRDSRMKTDFNCRAEEVTIEDVDEDEVDDVDDDEDEDEVEDVDEDEDEDEETETIYDEQSSDSQFRINVEVSQLQRSGQVDVNNHNTKEMEVGLPENEKEEERTPGFTVYVNRRPTSMAEVITDLEEQFSVVCNAGDEVSVLLEASRAQFSPNSNELSAMKMLNPVALFRSGSSRSSSSRFMISSSSPRENNEESSGKDLSEQVYMFSSSHQSTLDRLYAWEKKLYDEVRAGEKVRIAYEKKLKYLRNQDVRGDDPSSVDKTRASIRNLHTQITVSIHSIEAISRRIESLRDEELEPQLIELVHRLARMWKVMSQSHLTQKRALDEAKLLLATTPSTLDSRQRSSISSVIEPNRLARSALHLENALRNWRSCFESWTDSQNSYVHALTGWLLRCLRSDPNSSKLPFSPRRSTETPQIYGMCITWSRFLNDLHNKAVLDGLDFFSAGMGSIYSQQLKDDPGRVGSKRHASGFNVSGTEMVEFDDMDEVLTADKIADVAIRVLCAGMSVAVSSLTEFAIGCAEGYAELINQLEKDKCSRKSDKRMT